MDRTLTRRATTATLIAMLWLAAGPAAAAPPAAFGPSAPAVAEASLLTALWSWLSSLWTAGPEGSAEKTASPQVGDPGAPELSPTAPSDKGVLIDPNGRR